MNKEIVGFTVGKSILVSGGLGFIGSNFNSKRIKLVSQCKFWRRIERINMLFTNIPYEPKKDGNLGFSKKISFWYIP